MRRTPRCPACHGSGKMRVRDEHGQLAKQRCPHCRGHAYRGGWAYRSLLACAKGSCLASVAYGTYILWGIPGIAWILGAIVYLTLIHYADRD